LNTSAEKIVITKKRKILIAVLAAVAVSLAVTGLVMAGVIPLGASLSCLGVSGTSRSFTITADNTGYNDSKDKVGLGIWPIMNASRCDTVTIRLSNNDIQAHGLAVGGYTGEFTISPKQSFSVTFVAYKTGHWRVFCTITCSVHDYMQNAQLNIT
jgi:hypothetical protein